MTRRFILSNPETIHNLTVRLYGGPRRCFIPRCVLFLLSQSSFHEDLIADGFFFLLYSIYLRKAACLVPTSTTVLIYLKQFQPTLSPMELRLRHNPKLSTRQELISIQYRLDVIVATQELPLEFAHGKLSPVGIKFSSISIIVPPLPAFDLTDLS